MLVDLKILLKILFYPQKTGVLEQQEGCTFLEKFLFRFSGGVKQNQKHNVKLIVSRESEE